MYLILLFAKHIKTLQNFVAVQQCWAQTSASDVLNVPLDVLLMFCFKTVSTHICTIWPVDGTTIECGGQCIHLLHGLHCWAALLGGGKFNGKSVTSKVTVQLEGMKSYYDIGWIATRIENVPY